MNAYTLLEMPKVSRERSPTRIVIGALSVLFVVGFAPMLQAQDQDLKIIPAEDFVQTPGGVDMRTGRYIYRQTDLTAGEGENAFSFERTMPEYAIRRDNPFGNMSHNYDIAIVESRVDLKRGGTASGNDYRINVFVSGRALTFEGQELSAGYGYSGSGRIPKLTFTGSKTSVNAVYTVEDIDGTRMVFRPIGSGDCASQVLWDTPARCAYISSIERPDGTRLDFSYDATGLTNGNGARLARVESSRGFTLILEGTQARIAKACLINKRVTTPPLSNNCPSGQLTATYTYTTDPSPRLSSVTEPLNNQWNFSYSGQQMGFLNPGESSAWMTNTINLQLDETGVPQEIVTRQDYADGRYYIYTYNYTPPSQARTWTSVIGGSYSDADGNTVGVLYGFPVEPGTRQGETCTIFPCQDPAPDPFDYWVWQTTPGPIEVTDQLGRKTVFNYCDPVVEAGLPPDNVDRCAVVPVVDSTDPEGIQTFYEYDVLNNVTQATRKAKSGFGDPDIVRSATYDCFNRPASCTKPIITTDANGNVTNRTYATVHGGLLTEMGPAPTAGGARPLTIVTYTQRYARYRNTSGQLVQSQNPIWVIATETVCQTNSGSSPSPICDPGERRILTTYEYGAASSAEALLVKGMAVSSANGQTLRTCYGYDENGRRISETQPKAGLASCQ